MSNDSYTTVTSESWFSRIGGAFKGILFGLILFGIAFPILWFNEGRAVATARSLDEGAGIVVSVPSTSVSPENDGKLIHTIGEATTTDTLRDPEFGITEQVIRMRRKVEMYQWDEDATSDTTKKLGGGTETTTTYTYKKRWSARAIDSSNFKKSEGHQNPREIRYQDRQFSASNVELGAFRLSESLIQRMSSFEALPLSQAAIPEGLGEQVSVHRDTFYIGANPEKPAVGDIQVSFEVVRPGQVSVVGKQIGNSFEAYHAEAGKSVLLLSRGAVSAENMFASAQSANTLTTWILRLVGFFVMMFGLRIVFRVLPVIGDVVPFIGSLLEAGVGLIAFFIAAGLSVATIAIAWFVYRPLLSIVLLAVSVLLFLGMKKLKNKTARQA